MYVEVFGPAGRRKIDCDKIGQFLNEGYLPVATLQFGLEGGVLPEGMTFVPYAKPSRSGWLGRILLDSEVVGYVGLDNEITEADRMEGEPIEYAVRSFDWNDVPLDSLRECASVAGLNPSLPAEALRERLKAREFEPFIHGIDLPEEAYGGSPALTEVESEED